jgi:ABC-type proline/glycine betaine transport system permease subunit
MLHVHRRYLREFLPAMAAYVVVLLLSIWGLRHADATTLRVLLALSPVVPVAWAGRAVVRFVRDSDELDQRILLEAFALAALALTLGTFCLGLLVSAGVLPMRADMALIMVLPTYCLLYGLFACLARRRYQ